MGVGVAEEGTGLAEQAAISKAKKSRGLSEVNTDAMTVGTRYVSSFWCWVVGSHCLIGVGDP